MAQVVSNVGEHTEYRIDNFLDKFKGAHEFTGSVDGIVALDKMQP